MSRKRFSVLKRALELTKAPGEADGNSTTPPAPPAGSPLAKYYDYQQGKVDLKYPRNGNSKPQSFTEITVNPFAKAVAAENRVIIKCSKRVLARTTITGFVAVANHGAVDIETSDRLVGFRPAVALLTAVETAQSDADVKTSQITGIRYNPIEKESFSIPFGAVTGKTYLEVQKDFVTAAAATTAFKAKLKFRNEQI
jgi:hypothetical protein